MVFLRRRFIDHSGDLLGYFTNDCGGLVLCDVERAYYFLLAFRRCGEFFFVLERLIELIR